MSTPRIEHNELRTLTESIDRLRQRCATEGHELVRRATIPSQPDGYPKRASGANTGTASILGAISGQSDDPDDGYRVGHGDPTGEAACRPPTSDPVARTGRRFLRAIADAEASLHRATIELDNAQPRKGDDTATDDQWCANHLAHGMTEPRYRGDSCRRCYGFNLVEHCLPPYELLITPRWTEALIAKALGKVRRTTLTARR